MDEKPSGDSISMPTRDTGAKHHVKIGYATARSGSYTRTKTWLFVVQNVCAWREFVVLRSEKWPGLKLESLVSIEKHRAEEFRKRRHPEQWSAAEVTRGTGTIICDRVAAEEVEVENDNQKVI